jgi:hypothetical protein
MRHRLRSHLTYANVMVTILAFLVLGGGTALAAYVVSSNSQIGPGTVSGHKPPTGDHANIISKSITGQDLHPPQAWQEVTPSGTFLCGVSQCKFINWGAGRDTLGYYRDPYGVVRLKGFLCTNDPSGPGCNVSGGPDSNTTRIFTLPLGYRPDNTLELPTSSHGQFARVEIKPNGDVSADGNPPWQYNDFYVDGISFRCGPSGKNGCP